MYYVRVMRSLDPVGPEESHSGNGFREGPEPRSVSSAVEPTMLPAADESFRAIVKFIELPMVTALYSYTRTLMGS